jgi:hypothetical protein
MFTPAAICATPKSTGGARAGDAHPQDALPDLAVMVVTASDCAGVMGELGLNSSALAAAVIGSATSAANSIFSSESL